jgi:GMP synthase (glutamine-hydrolysing)
LTTAPPGDAERVRILRLDYGSQITQLIERRIREHDVYCEIHPPTLTVDDVREWNPAGIVLSGGPSSVLDAESPDLDPALVALGVPALGIRYALQLLAHRLGGLVEMADDREYGRALFKHYRVYDSLSSDLPGGAERVVWMSHGDRVLRLPEGFTVLGASESSPFAAVRHAERPIWSVQFHPEVAHTEAGSRILANFAHRICGCTGSWTMQAFIDEATERVREQVGDRRVVCGLSGGVDSSVAAVLVHRAIGEQLTCVFVDDVLRGSPLVGLADVTQRLARDLARLTGVVQSINGETGVSAFGLNAGIARGPLRVFATQEELESGEYARSDIVLLPETVAELSPVAGIVTLGEGSPLSHAA